MPKFARLWLPDRAPGKPNGACEHAHRFLTKSSRTRPRVGKIYFATYTAGGRARSRLSEVAVRNPGGLGCRTVNLFGEKSATTHVASIRFPP